MSSSSRQSYHTHVKFLAREGLLSTHLLKQIPRTNVHRWRHEAIDKYNSLGINSAGIEEYKLMKAFAADKHARQVFAAYVRIIKTLASVAHSIPEFHKHIKKNRLKVLEVVRRVKSVIGLKKSLRFFNISVSTYKQWSLDSLFKFNN